MNLPYQEHIRRCLMINGAYFHPHVMHRAEERLSLSNFDHDHFEQKIIQLDGDLFYDKTHQNYQISLNDLAFAFELELHQTRPGLLAYVTTALTNPNDFRDDDKRYKRLRPADYSGNDSKPVAEKIIKPALKDDRR